MLVTCKRHAADGQKMQISSKFHNMQQRRGRTSRPSIERWSLRQRDGHHRRGRISRTTMGHLDGVHAPGESQTGGGVDDGRRQEGPVYAAVGDGEEFHLPSRRWKRPVTRFRDATMPCNDVRNISHISMYINICFFNKENLRCRLLGQSTVSIRVTQSTRTERLTYLIVSGWFCDDRSTVPSAISSMESAPSARLLSKRDDALQRYASLFTSRGRQAACQAARLLRFHWPMCGGRTGATHSPCCQSTTAHRAQVSARQQ
jgi:hypothetical protein